MVDGIISHSRDRRKINEMVAQAAFDSRGPDNMA